MRTGNVILVGAGPGDPGLLTRKGLEAISQAEVVVFDRLVGPEILGLIPENAEKIDVGKQASNHPVPQYRINQILLEKALEGKRVVRLKGGDPFLFGRGGEELELLKEHGIPFQEVPGVTSALSVPAYAGIPVTHRDYCSSVHIITGHAKAGAELKIDFDALRRTKGTLVFLMGVTALPMICKGLLDSGMDGGMPAAVIERGTLPRQRKVVSTLAELPKAAEDAKIVSPAIIVVGRVCGLSDSFDWFDNLPLKGREIIVTRPAERNGSLCGKLSALGASVTAYPCIRTVERVNNPELDTAIGKLNDFRWLVFTSPAGPGIFFKHLRKQHMDARALAGLKIAAIGPKTAAEVEKFGVLADLVPETYDSDHLAQAMSGVEGSVLLCRASEGSDALPRLFAEKGISFADIACYDTVYEAPNSDSVKELVESGAIVTFTSASTVRGFARSLPDADYSNIIGCCIGRQTAAEAEQYGIPVRIAEKATMDSLIECIKGVC